MKIESSKRRRATLMPAGHTHIRFYSRGGFRWMISWPRSQRAYPWQVEKISGGDDFVRACRLTGLSMQINKRKNSRKLSFNTMNRLDYLGSLNHNDNIASYRVTITQSIFIYGKSYVSFQSFSSNFLFHSFHIMVSQCL